MVKACARWVRPVRMPILCLHRIRPRKSARPLNHARVAVAERAMLRPHRGWPPTTHQPEGTQACAELAANRAGNFGPLFRNLGIPTLPA